MILTTQKIVLVVVVILAIGAGVYYWYSSQPQGQPQEQGMPNNVSDLQKDADAIDAQIKSFEADNASINSVLKDKQVPQSSI